MKFSGLLYAAKPSPIGLKAYRSVSALSAHSISRLFWSFVLLHRFRIETGEEMRIIEGLFTGGIALS